MTLLIRVCYCMLYLKCLDRLFSLYCSKLLNYKSVTLYIYSIWRLKWVFSWKKFNAILNYKTGESMRVWFWRFLFRNTLVYGSYKLTFIRERENFTRFVVKIHRRSLYRTVVKLTRILFAKFSRWKPVYYQ